MKIKANSYDIKKSLNGEIEITFKVDKESNYNVLNMPNEKELNGSISVEIKKWANQRSLNANAYFHLIVNKISQKLKVSDSETKIRLNLEYGTPATDKNGNNVVIKLPKDVDITQFYDYAKWIGDKQEKIATSYYLLYKQTHTLNSVEMARLIDGVIYEANELDIETITIEEKAKMLSLWREYEK